MSKSVLSSRYFLPALVLLSAMVAAQASTGRLVVPHFSFAAQQSGITHKGETLRATATATKVPEPGTVVIFGLGVAIAIARRRKRRT